jgi:ADP-ribose pyrophosphatase YjhB (NUDIX family)
MLRLLSVLPAPLTKRLVQAVSLLRNPYTLGVRVIVLNEDRQVLLVRHSYLPGWYLPGGGVDLNEVMADAVRRELLEEAGVSVTGIPRLLGVYLNKEGLGRDHIGLFEVPDWAPAANFLLPNAEIVEAGFFSPDSLPEETTRATAVHIAEHFSESRVGGAVAGLW